MSVSENEANISEKADPDALALELTCPICLELFSEPVSIPCGHIYCADCLQAMGGGQDQHSCPECQAEFKTDDLVRSFKMHSIIETYKATAFTVNTTAKPSAVDHASVKSANRIGTEESNTKYHQDPATAGKGMEVSSVCQGKDGFRSTKEPFPFDEEQGKGTIDAEEESKFRLASEIPELTLKLEAAESALAKEKERELELTAVNGQLREKAFTLMGQMKDLSQIYSTQVLQLIEEELGPDEAHVGRRVIQASELTERLRQTVLRAESLLTGEDGPEFGDELLTLQPHIVELLAKPVQEEEDHVDSKGNHAQICPRLEGMNADLRKRFGEIQRCLRNALNPSEVTFDPETAHPNLVLSEDRKTVTFSASKQPYPPSPQRFTNFLQVLSTQSFFDGEHCWDVELEGSPWIIGLCHCENLARSGMPSALESSRSSWCLMWFDNLLTAFEQGHSVPLKKTTLSRRLEITLSFKTHRLSFYNISPSSGKTHVYTFKTILTKPVHLAYRMMSGHPNARVTVHS